MGGRHPVGQVALVLLTTIAVVAWALRQAVAVQGVWQPTWASLLLLLGVALVGFQLVPLSGAWLARLSPRAMEILPLWAPGAEALARLGVWSQISLTPSETKAGLILLVNYSLLFLVTVQRVHRVEDIERVLHWCALAAVAMAGFGLIQFFTSNGRFFWFYEAPYSTTSAHVTGAFTNRNHFAHFLALGIGPLVWWLYRAVSSTHDNRWSPRVDRGPSSGARQFVWIGAAAAMVVFAGLLSLSRGGNTVLLMAALVAAIICGRAAAVRGRFLLGIAAAGSIVILLLYCYGYQRVSDRLSDLSSGSLERLDRESGRRRVWAAVATATADFPLFGSGVGSLREVCPIYLKDPPERVVFTHAENGPLQEALETGLAGAALLAGGIGFCAFWCVAGLRRASSTRLQACLGAITASLAASLVHAMVDFVWYVPACTAIVAILAASACRAWQLGCPPNRAAAARPLPRAVALAVAVFVAVTSVAMIGNRFRAAVAQHYWDRACVAMSRPERLTPQQQDMSAPENRQREIDSEKRLLAEIEQVVHWYPEHTQAHLALARCHLHLFDLGQITAPNPMPLGQVRDAAIASAAHFPSRQARDEWMQRAFGEHCSHLHRALEHTRAGLQRCPLQGAGYLYLAELSFLDGPAALSKQACVDQALRVRPFDGNVLDAAARESYEALLEGNVSAWLGLARRVVQSQRGCKKRLIEDLVGNTPPEGLPAVIEFVVTQLKPDVQGLTFLYHASKGRTAPEQLRPLQRYYAEMAEFEAKKASGHEASQLWTLAAGAHADMNNQAETLRCARNAHLSDPSDLATRSRLACLLLAAGHAEEARSHLLQCLRRAPDNRALQVKYREAIRRIGSRSKDMASRECLPTH